MKFLDKIIAPGGNMSGPLNLANMTWNGCGDDAWFGDHNHAGSFCIKGTNGETALCFVKNDNDGDHDYIRYTGSNTFRILSTFLKKWSGDNQSSALVFQNDNSNAPYTGIGLCKPSATGVGGNFVEWQWDGSHVNLSTNGTYLTVEGVEPISFESVGTNATRVIIRGTRKTGKAQMICYGTLNMGEADYYFDIPYSTHPQVFLSFPPGTPNTYILMGLSESQFTLDRPVSEEGGVGFFAIGEISV